jgi:serine/threonine protein kinase
MPTCDRDRLGRYNILAELGRGAMGTVYKARDPKIDRLVAIKTISMPGSRPEEAHEYRERFFREAQAAGRLSHPGVTTVFDVNEDPECGPYIVMEYVPGKTLEQLLSDGSERSSLRTVLDLVDQLAQALHHAHAQGIVHRDIKPANIIVTDDGRAKITDFGVAKLDLSQFTLQGLVLGTPSYMSPEQLNGESVDARSDLFSLGVVLYTMLTGYRPFQGNSAATVSFKVVYKDPVPVSVLNSALPVNVDYIVSRAMAKAPGNRYQSGQELSFDIQDIQAGHAPRSRDGNSVQSTADQTVVQRAAQSGGGMARPGGTGSSAFRGQANGADSLSAHESSDLRDALKAARTRWGNPALFGLLSAIAAFGGWAVHGTGRGQSLAPQTVSTPAPSSQSPTLEQVVALCPVAISVHHPFAFAVLSIWADDKLAYKRQLRGQVKKRMLVLQSVQGSFSGTVSVPAGKHEIRVQVSSDVDRYRRTASIRGDFSKDKRKTLDVSIYGHSHEMTVSLN